MEIEVVKDWQKSTYALCLSVVGAVVCIRAVPAIIRAVSQVILRSRFKVTPTASWVSLISVIMYFALGFYFIGGAKEIVRIALKGSLREPDSDNT